MTTSYLLVENGGEIFTQVDRPTAISINTGTSPFSKHILFNLTREVGAVGIGTSSASIGHTLTFGEADTATVMSDTTALADAAATALGNIVKAADDIPKAIEKAKSIEGLRGVVIIVGDKMGVWGKVRIVPLG